MSESLESKVIKKKSENSSKPEDKKAPLESKKADEKITNSPKLPAIINSKQTIDSNDDRVDEISNAVAKASEFLEDTKPGEEKLIIESDDPPSFAYDKFKQGSNPNPIYSMGRVVDYESEVLSQIGGTIAKDIYDSFSSKSITSFMSSEQVQQQIVTAETVEKIMFKEKYTITSNVNGFTGLIAPVEGVSSEKWEAFKIEMIMDPAKAAMYRSLR